MNKFVITLVCWLLFEGSFAQIWQQIQDFPGGKRDDAVGCAVGNVGVVGSGRNEWFEFENSFYAFDGANWFPIESIPGNGRQYMLALSFENGAYVYGGVGVNDSCFGQLFYLNENLAWIEVKNIPLSDRYSASGFTLGNKIYLGFGRNANSTMQDWWSFLPSQNLWDSLLPFPGGARYEAAALPAGGCGFVGLGKNHNGDYFNDWWKYSPLTNQWKKLSDFPGSQRTYATFFERNNQIHILQGMDAHDNFVGEWWVYDIFSDTWENNHAPLFPKRRGSSWFVIHNCIHVVGGLSPMFTRLDEAYQNCLDEIPEFRLYPNPFLSRFWVETSFSGHKKVELYDLQGRLIWWDNTSDETVLVEVEQLQPGAYVVIISSERITEVLKVVKQH